MREKFGLSLLAYVALRKESVDRNLWWELSNADHPHVALRKESVDRNLSYNYIIRHYWRRSPQGERG